MIYISEVQATDFPSDEVEIAPVKTQQRLLIVDDQPVNIQTLYQIFSQNYQITMATNGKQALALCKNVLPDLILLDVEMPDMNGYEVCRRIKADPISRNIPVIFITSHHNAIDETNGLNVGAVDFIVKPVNPQIVQARVKNHLHSKAQYDLLRDWVYTDGLTNIKNRRYFDERINAEYGRALRNNSVLSAIMLDIDLFKQYNDFYGHLKGDECLQKIATKLDNRITRAGDLFARYGGEEFICLLPDTNFIGAMNVAEQLKEDVLSLQIPHEASTVNKIVTLSLGVSTASEDIGNSSDSLINQADAQLYLAKKNGRNQVCGVEL